MPKKSPSLLVSRLNGGVNRFDQYAEQDQCDDALNVIEYDGVLRRRPAFHAIATGCPRLLPAGQTMVENNAGGMYSRTFAIDAADIGGTNDNLIIGCREKFNGIDWRYVTDTPTDPTANTYLAAQYWNGSSWVTIETVDTTRARMVDSSDNVFFQTLCQNGRISWHLPSFTSSWTTRTVDSLTWYSIRLSVYTLSNGSAKSAGGVITGTGNIELAAPGPRAFVLDPVRSIMPVRPGRKGRSMVLVGSDLLSATSKADLGAQLGIIESFAKDTDIAQVVNRTGVSLPTDVVGDEGGGINGQVTWNTWQRAAPGQAWPGGTWTDTTIGGGTDGSSGVLTKHRADYDWVPDQFRGGPLFGNFTGVTSASQDTTTRRGTFTLPTGGVFDSIKADELKGCMIYVVEQDPVPAGPLTGEEMEIISNTAASGGSGAAITYAGTFANAAVSTTTFAIFRPHSGLRIEGSDYDYQVFDNDEDTVTVTSGEDYAPDMASADNNQYVQFKITKPLIHVARGAEQWDHAFDVVTQKVLLTNGASGILEFDGVSLRPLAAMTDETSARVLDWIGTLPDQTKEQLSSRSLAGSKLARNPPSGKFVASYMGRIVVANIGSRPYDVQWSAPAPDNDIWPNLYRTRILDSENNEITGMAVLFDRLYVWTPTSIHMAFQYDDSGAIAFKPVSQGIGFVNKKSVGKIGNASNLIGPAADGVYVFDGVAPRIVLDRWDHLLKGGVNEAQLDQAVGAVSLHRNEYYLAVAPAGTLENTRVLVYNYLTDKWWVWSSPWGGITSIARDFDAKGNETMLFGCEDGHVAVLRSADTDDGDTITGRARSIPLELMKTQTVTPNDLVVQFHELGDSESMTVRHFINRRGTAHAEPSVTVAALSSTYDTNGFSGHASPATYSGDRIVTRKVAIPAGSRCEVYQFEIEGTSQFAFRQAELLVNPQTAHESRRK